MRADARQNYEAIVRAAVAEIDRVGANASLEDIARNAGVGSATLHRRFRTRRELLQAVFADRIERVCARADELSSSLSPGDALQRWLLELAQFSASTRGVADTLIIDTAPDPLSGSCETLLITTATTLRNAAVDAGQLKPSASALDLLALVNSISLGARAAADPVEYATRLVTLAIIGIRP